MSPTYNDGDWLLFRALFLVQTLRPERLIGKAVVIERESYPGVLFIKRVKTVDQTGFWVEGDNIEASTDSRQWGSVAPSEIVGLVLVRYQRKKINE